MVVNGAFFLLVNFGKSASGFRRAPGPGDPLHVDRADLPLSRRRTMAHLVRHPGGYHRGHRDTWSSAEPVLIPSASLFSLGFGLTFSHALAVLIPPPVAPSAASGSRWLRASHHRVAPHRTPPVPRDLLPRDLAVLGAEAPDADGSLLGGLIVSASLLYLLESCWPAGASSGP